jgi:drug/metabolite transporter (DMT)-like permease
MTLTVFLLALISPLLYATTNIIDKILLEKYFKEGGVGTLMMFSSLLSFLALPIIFIAEPNVLDVSAHNALLLAGIAILDLLVLWFYLLALENDDTSVVILFYQLVPAFALILGYFILGELPTPLQFLAMAIIMIGTTFVSFEIDEKNKLRFHSKTVLYMTIACFFWALESVLFKNVALEENVWRSLFWEHLILVLIGVLMFIFLAKYRKSFLRVFKNNSWKILSANTLNESLYMISNSTVAFVAMMAPVALVLLNVPIQSIFVFVIGAALTLLAPRILKEKMNKRALIQKIAAIIITGIGTYILIMSSGA